MKISAKYVGYGIVLIIAGCSLYSIHALPDTATLAEVLCTIKNTTKKSLSGVFEVNNAINTIRGE